MPSTDFLGYLTRTPKKNLNECPVQSKWPLREKMSILKLENVCDTFLSGHMSGQLHLSTEKRYLPEHALLIFVLGSTVYFTVTYFKFELKILRFDYKEVKYHLET